MRRIPLLTVLAALAALLAPPAHAVDYRVDLSYPAADQTALRAAVGGGLSVPEDRHAADRAHQRAR